MRARELSLLTVHGHVRDSSVWGVWVSVLCVERASASGRACEQESVFVLTCDSELPHPCEEEMTRP